MLVCVPVIVDIVDEVATVALETQLLLSVGLFHHLFSLLVLLLLLLHLKFKFLTL